MKVGLYSGHLYTGGQVGSGASKCVYYLIRELEGLGVEVVRLRKGENPDRVAVLHDPHAPWNAPLRPRRPLVIRIHDLTPRTHPQYYPRWVRTLFVGKLRWFLRRCARVLVDSGRTAQVLSSTLGSRAPVDVIPLGVEDRFAVKPEPAPGGRVPTSALLPFRGGERNRATKIMLGLVPRSRSGRGTALRRGTRCDPMRGRTAPCGAPRLPFGSRTCGP